MANPTLTVEVKSIGAGKVRKEINELQKAGRGLSNQQIKTNKTTGAAADATSNLGAEVKKSSTRVGAFKNKMQEMAKSASLALGPLNGVAARITSFTGLVSTATFKLATLIGSIIAVGAGAVKATRDFMRFEEEILRIEGALIATGRASELSLDRIENFARTLGEETLTSASQVRQAAAALITFRGIGEESFERVLRVSQDVSDTFGGTLLSNVQRLARTLDDMTSSITRLGRRGAVFTQQEQKIIDRLGELGFKSQRTEMILSIMEKRMKGISENAARGLSGALDTLRERITRLFETLGSDLSPTIERLTRAISDAINPTNKLAEAIKAITAAFTVFLSLGILKFALALIPGFRGLSIALKPLIGVVSFVSGAFVGFKNEIIKVGEETFKLQDIMLGAWELIRVRTAQAFKIIKQDIVTVFNDIKNSISEATDDFNIFIQLAQSGGLVLFGIFSGFAKTLAAIAAISVVLRKNIKALRLELGRTLKAIQIREEERFSGMLKGEQLPFAETSPEVSQRISQRLAEEAPSLENLIGGDALKKSLEDTEAQIKSIIKNLGQDFAELTSFKNLTDQVKELRDVTIGTVTEMKLQLLEFSRFQKQVRLFDESKKNAREVVKELQRLSEINIKPEKSGLTEFLQRVADKSDSIANAFTSAAESILTQGESIKEALSNLAREVVKIVIKVLLLDRLKAGLTSAFGSIGSEGAGFGESFVKGFTGSIGAGAGTTNAKGNAFQNGSVTPFRNGGVVSQPSFFPLSNSGFGTMAEEGPEGILPLKRGKGGRLGVSLTGRENRSGSKVEIVNNNDFSQNAGPFDIAQIDQLLKRHGEQQKAEIQELINRGRI